MDDKRTTGAARDGYSHIGGNTRPAVLSWGLFWRMVFAQAAPLFLVAASICFFAYNWAAMPVMAKFGLIILLVLCSAGLALWRGLESTAGSLGLLACGLLAGPLLAVYGQAYQTGADPWELFRAWSLFLIPLALVGRRTGLWFALWVTATLWAGLYLIDLARFADHRGDDLFLLYTFYLAAGQAAALILWETAASRFTGPERPFLRSRWLPRVAALPLMVFLTCVLAACMLSPREMPFGPLHLILYLVLMSWGYYHYTQKKRDSLMIAYGLMSPLSLATTLPLIGIDRFEGLLARCLMVVLILAGGAAISVKALVRYHAGSFPAIRPEDASGREAGVKESETDGKDQRPEDTEPYRHPAHEPDAAGFQAARPKDGLSLSSVYAPRLMRFALSGELSSGKKGAAADRAAGAPWPARVLAGLCAWIAAPFVVALLGLLLASTMGTEGLIVLLILAAAAGAFLSRLPGKGVFKDQAALCLTLAGTLGAGVLYAGEYSRHLPYLPLLILFAVGTFAVDNAIYRFFAAAIGIPVLALTVLLPGLDGSSFYYFFKSVEESSLVSPVVPALFFSLLCVALAHIRTMPAAGRPDSGGLADPRWSPSLAGCHAALFLMGVPSFGGFLLLFGGFLPLFDMIGVGAGVGLVYLAFRVSRQLGLPVPQQAFFLIVSAAVACISLRLPWFGTGLFALALSRRAGSTPLMGLAILGLAVGVNLEYYSLNTSLLHKSVSLAAIGLLLTAAALVLHRLLLTAVRTGRLPDPLLLLADENVTSPATDTSPNTAPNATSPAGGRAIPRRAIAAACLGLFLALFGWSVMQKERLLASGDQIILALRPVDPRSLMQGDYMVLRLAVEEDIRHALYGLSDDDRALAKGVAVVEVEQGKPARFKRLDNGSSLADGEKRLVFRGREGEIQVSSGAFFFQEGHGKAYERARFALLRVDGSGNALITALLDERMETIRPELEEEQPDGGNGQKDR